MLKSDIECDITTNIIFIDTYAKCGHLLASRNVFDTMECRDFMSQNTLINFYTQSQSYNEGLKIFKEMNLDVTPDLITYVTVLSISTRLGDIKLGKEIHYNLAKVGFHSDLIVGNT